MGKKIKLYLDTSVISALFDSMNPERQELTKTFFQKTDLFEIYVSELVFVEIDNIKDAKIKDKFKDVIIDFNILQIDEESRKLADEYVKHGAIPQNYSEDALHIALATLNEIDYLLSWNFRHIVKMKTRRIVNMTNFSLGYPDLKIMTPAEII